MAKRRTVLIPFVCAVAALVAASCTKDNATPSSPSTSCSFSVAQPATSFAAEGGSGTATVTTASGCAWTAASSATFVTITAGASGSGNGAAQFTVAANTGAARTSTLTVAGSAITITQAAAVTTPPVTPATLTAPTARSPIGGVTVDPGRPTLVVDNAASTGAIGTVTYRFEISDSPLFPGDAARTVSEDGIVQGTGTTSWVVRRDLGPGTPWYWRARATNGTLVSAYSIAETFRTAGSSCTAAVSPASAAIAAGGGTSTIVVTIGSGCVWSAVSNDAFLTVSSGGSGTGNGTVTVAVAANTGAARSGTLTIAGQTVTVSQAAAAATSVIASFELIDPSSQSGATTECRFRGPAASSTTCTLRSTSFTLGPTTVVSYAWSVQYTYGTVVTLSGTSSNLSFTDSCGKDQSTDAGAANPLSVSLTVTDSAGATATATAGAGSQPGLFVRLFTCGF
jgi:hypothetical protein